MDEQTNAKQKRTWTHHEDNRERLIAAGYTLLAEQGIEATTVKEIARLAGVSPGLFHYYFASKNDLLLAVVYEAGVSFSQRLMQTLESMSSRECSFGEVVMLAVAAVSRDDPAWYRLRYELYALGLRNPGFLLAIGEMLAKGRQGIAQTIQLQTGMDDVRAETLAAVVQACTDGLALQQLAQPGLDLTAAYQLVQRLFVAEPSSDQ
ncbi:TetR/AcrR family transcriptional regulator [Ktedonospora formicarum]|uniref:TetR family transcriptional regulator n=1 Tax=Ktedonospora formicarum TaxID=2778364 RepID=A0A8J3IEV9_9CHLR|nr:TetR/AcrR family transcriptional regulator [Ktedonospora formicarum]GHO50674.1 TetR family transcriptional regulator [Ktedonospora formicarum]